MSCIDIVFGDLLTDLLTLRAWEFIETAVLFKNIHKYCAYRQINFAPTEYDFAEKIELFRQRTKEGRREIDELFQGSIRLGYL